MKELTLKIKEKNQNVKAILQDGVLKRTFTISLDQLASYIGTDFNAGFMMVNGDGIIHVSEQGGDRLYIAQRALVPETSIIWDDHRNVKTKKVSTPWTYLAWRLRSKGNNKYSLVKERIYIGDGEWHGGATRLFSGHWMGNIYEYHPGSYQSSNICWGNVSITGNEGIVGSMTVLHTLNKFFDLPFTNHIEPTSERWDQFTEKGSTDFLDIYGEGWSGTLEDVVEGMYRTGQ